MPSQDVFGRPEGEGSAAGRSPSSASPLEPSPVPPPPLPPRFTLDRVIRFLLGLGTLAIIIWLVWYFSLLVVFLVVGVVLAYLMNPLVDRLRGIGVGPIPAILVTFVLVLGGIALMVTQLVPFASSQIREISQRVTLHAAVAITAVDTGGPADRAGLSVGDAILALEGQPWDGFGRLQTVLSPLQPGDSVSVTVEARDGGRAERYLVLRQDRGFGEEASRVGIEAGGRYIPPLGIVAEEIVLSNVTIAVERWISAVLPIERRILLSGITVGLSRLFEEGTISTIAGSIVGVFTDLFYALLVIPFVAFFFLKDDARIRRSLLRWIPNRYFEPALALVERIETSLGRYFRALMIQVLAVAALSSALLYMVGLQYALAVGLFTGLANTIPYFGPLMGFLAGTLVGIVQEGNLSLVPEIILAMVLTQAADNVIFQPYIFSRAARTHPLVILFAVLIGAQVAGLVGMFVAIPLITVVRVTVEQLLWSLRNYRILKSG